MAIPEEPPTELGVGISQMMHGEDWDGKQDLTGWLQLASSHYVRWMSEKLDGVRGFWDGKSMKSKNGKDIHCPNWFTEGLPGICLDGELWMGRGTLEKSVATINSGNPDHQNWKSMKFMVFDLPDSTEPYESRMEAMKQLKLPAHAQVVESSICPGNEYLLKSLSDISNKGGEGYMLNKPKSLYVQQRTNTMLKVKVPAVALVTLSDERAVRGSGARNHSQWPLLPTVREPLRVTPLRANGTESVVGCFREDLEQPPEIGSVITVQHNGFYQNGTLRHAFFWKRRPDIRWDDSNKRPIVSQSPLTHCQDHLCRLDAADKPAAVL